MKNDEEGSSGRACMHVCIYQIKTERTKNTRKAELFALVFFLRDTDTITLKESLALPELFFNVQVQILIFDVCFLPSIHPSINKAHPPDTFFFSFSFRNRIASSIHLLLHLAARTHPSTCTVLRRRKEGREGATSATPTPNPIPFHPPLLFAPTRKKPISPLRARTLTGEFKFVFGN